ncbi:MAG: VWA domain-containing protein [Spirochaetaceae bacterium]|jgi:Ca-activated chloride channel family protein|nr:VWA domain-containing protein [Spirochaetaceae bacterium]
MLTFDKPAFAVAAFAAPFVIFALRRFFRGAFRLSFSLGTPGGDCFKASAGFRLFAAFLNAADYVVASLLLLASAGPKFVVNETVWLERGADVLFVLDCSPSMAGIDMAGKSRFDAARELIRNFAENRPADAVGLAALGNDAALLIPPTVDRNALFDRLDRLAIGELGDGTALGTALVLAAFHLENSAANRKIAVLITDGENNAGAVHPLAAAAALGEQGAILYVIGVGSSGEIPVDYIDPVTKTRRMGSFESRYSHESLIAIAGAADGKFMYAPGRDSFETAFGALNRAEPATSRSVVRGRENDLSDAFAAAALALCFLSRLLRALFLGAPL